MSTPTEEITLDIDALDAKAAEEAARKAKKGANGTDLDPLKVETTDQPPAVTAKTVVTPEEGLQKLQKQLDDERAARQAAEARANEAAQGEANARVDVQKTQLDMVKGAIEQLTLASDTLETQYEAALTAQDFKAAAKAQREMANNAAKLAQLEAGKAALEKAPKPTPRAPVDPVEAFASQLQAPSAAWVRAHPEFVRDQHKHQQMLAAHQLAIARGHKAETPEYFASIEKTLDLAAPITRNDENDDDDPMKDAARPANGGGRSVAPASAPVSRSGSGNGSTQNGRSIKLTLDQQEAARASFPDSKTPLEDYARQLVALRKEGKLS
jgi:hypothetical protein